MISIAPLVQKMENFQKFSLPTQKKEVKISYTLKRHIKRLSMNYILKMYRWYKLKRLSYIYIYIFMLCRYVVVLCMDKQVFMTFVLLFILLTPALSPPKGSFSFGFQGNLGWWHSIIWQGVCSGSNSFQFRISDETSLFFCVTGEDLPPQFSWVS